MEQKEIVSNKILPTKKSAKKLKLAIIYPELNCKRGSQNVVMWCANLLDKTKYDITLFTKSINLDLWNEYKNEFEIKLLDNKIFGFYAVKSSYIQAFLYKNIFKKQLSKFDIVFTHNYPTNVWVYHALKNIRNKPYIIYYCQEPRRLLWGYLTDSHQQELNKYYNLENTKPKIRKSRQKIDILATKFCDKILCNSNFSKLNIKKIYNLDADICLLGIAKKNNNIISINKRPNNLIALLPFEYAKNPLVIVKTIDYLVNKCNFTDFRLYLIGKGHLNELIINFIKEKNIEKFVELKDYINEEEKQELLNNSKIGLYLTIDEPFGLTVLEYMQYGLISIVSDHGGPSEIISNNKTGFLVNPFDEKQIGDKIINILTTHNFENISKNAIEEVNQKFLLNHFIERLEKYLLFQNIPS